MVTYEIVDSVNYFKITSISHPVKEKHFVNLYRSLDQENISLHCSYDISVHSSAVRKSKNQLGWSL